MHCLFRCSEEFLSLVSVLFSANWCAFFIQTWKRIYEQLCLLTTGAQGVQKWTQFVTSAHKAKVIQALDFRNRFAHRPFLCSSLIPPEDIVVGLLIFFFSLLNIFISSFIYLFISNRENGMSGISNSVWMNVFLCVCPWVFFCLLWWWGSVLFSKWVILLL